MSNLLDNIGKFRTLSDEEFAKLVSKPQKYEQGGTLPDDAYYRTVNSAFTRHYLRISGEDFIEKYMRQRLEGITREDVLKLVHDTCLFFHLNDACEVIDVSNTSVTTQMRSYPYEEQGKDELYYNLDELITMGVITVDAFTLVLTHEFAHRYFKNQVFRGWNRGAWEMELACDFFAGVRSRINLIHATGMRWSLERTQGTKYHPPGDLRMAIIEYGREVAYKLSLKQTPPTLDIYLKAYNFFIEKKARAIWERQQKIINGV